MNVFFFWKLLNEKYYLAATYLQDFKIVEWYFLIYQNDTCELHFLVEQLINMTLKCYDDIFVQ